MMRTLFTAATGLNSFQMKMDVLANNFANANTTGYKSQRLHFHNILNETLGQSSAPILQDAATLRGSVNSKQVGLGVLSASIDTLMGQGNLKQTNVQTDIAIQGRGFFTVQDEKGDQFYTRAGDFNLDSLGYMVHVGTGKRLLGWQALTDEDTRQTYIDKTQELDQLNIASESGTDFRILEPRSTANVHFRCNLDSDAPIGTTHATSLTVYDEAGNPYMSSYTFMKSEVIDLDNDGADGVPAHLGIEHKNEVLGPPDGLTTQFTVANTPVVPGNITVRRNGIVVSNYTPVTDQQGFITGIDFDTVPEIGDTIEVDYRQRASIDDDGASDGVATVWTYQVAVVEDAMTVMPGNTDVDATENGIQLAGPQQAANDPALSNMGGSGVLVFDNTTGRINEALTFFYNNLDPLSNEPAFSVNDYDPAIHSYVNNFIIQPEGAASPDVTISPVFDNVTQFSSDFSTAAIDQDGFSWGAYKGLSIARDGHLNAQYDNGYNKMIGQLTLTDFNNPAGLFRASDTMYTLSANSGAARLEEPGLGTNGMLVPGMLEMSNVNLANEFAVLVYTQRAFQMNSSAMKTGDRFLEQAIGLKR